MQFFLSKRIWRKKKKTFCTGCNRRSVDWGVGAQAGKRLGAAAEGWLRELDQVARPDRSARVVQREIAMEG
eukprot:COSAG04_NODE_22108_length_361_cov_0.595420_1_plen_70_part_10